MHEQLSNDNFLEYCAQYYDNPQCVSHSEFLEDLARIKYIKKLFTRYSQTGELKERLILNHLIILTNVFGPVVLPRILWLKMHNQFHYMKPFLMTLNILPKKIYNIGKKGRAIDTAEIPIDQHIIDVLRKI